MRNINEYLSELASRLTVEESRKQKIAASFDNLEGLLFKEFRSELDRISIFGSYDRGTAFSLPGDKHNFDVDVLIVFRKDQFQPQTYLNKLKALGKDIYPRSPVSTSHPTVSIELNLVRFELVPAYKTGSGTILKIPAPRSKEEKWIETDPDEFKKKLIRKDSSENGNIIPLVKLAKYWNIMNGGHFSSYYLEKLIVDEGYSSCRILKDYFFGFISDIQGNGKTDSQKKAISDLNEKKRILKVLESDRIPHYIEPEFNSFMPFP